MVSSRSVVVAAALSLFQVTQAWNVELPPCTTPFQPFVYSGCYQDGAPGTPPALIFRSPLSSSNMTVEICVAECKGNGFRYAGLEYHGVCFCGGTVDGPQLDESQCNFKCNGNSSETCGGNNILSVWQDPTFPTTPVTVGSYVASGCYSDSSKAGRALSWSATVNATTFTTESCLAACEAEGFPLAGTEFGSECWCGNVIANNSTQVDDSKCNKPCKGNTAEICGGSSLLNLYVAKDLESLQPCGYQPPVSSSTTTVSTTSSTSTTAPADTTTTTAPADTTTTAPADTTTTTAPADTTTTTAPADTTTTTSCTTSTTQSPPTTTAAPTTTKPPTTTTTTSSALCTITVTTPPSCEYKCGSWCFPPLPDWGNQNDCLKAYATCAASVASCFSQAGFPGALECFNFGQWCSGIQTYCGSTCKYGKCSKGDCWNKNPGQGNPSTSTTVVPCKATTTTKAAPPTTTSTKCPPTPTNICTQPSNPKYGYGPGNPVGGIALPLVSCNDIYSDWRSNPFKLYNNLDSKNCPSYPRPSCGNACSDACHTQYQQCVSVYQQGCQSGANGRWKRGEEVERGLFLGVSLFTQNWGFGGNSPSNAAQKCQAQYSDCLSVNKNVNPQGKCTTWGW